MSNKSKSHMPNGGYTLTQGSNYMMDGFHFDTEYGGGPQEKARLPEARGLADLPSGMIPLDSSGISMLPDGLEHQADLNMGEITREANQDVSLVDHSWLASQPEPDLSGVAEMEQVYKDLADGHMNNPSNNQLKALEQSWGQTSTTGLDIIPNENRHHAPYRNNYSDEQSHLPGDDYREEMERNIRKLAYGHPLNVVLSEVDETQVLNVKSKIASEYGLHGRVYIKEEHFPGLFNGRWDEVINKRCATAMFIIPKSKDCAFDRFLGMQVVNQVPWKKAANALLPKLESYGVRLASGSSKSRLQTAFIDLIEGRVDRLEKSATWFPTQSDQSSLISLDHARRELENAREENIFVASSEDVEQSKIEMKLNRIATQLINQGFLDSEQVSAVVESNRTASKKIERLYELASTPMETGSYGGQGIGVKAHTPHKSKIEENFKTRSELNLEQRFASAKDKIGRIVKAGMITSQEASSISSRFDVPEDKVKAVFNHIAKNIENLASTYEGQGIGVKLLLPTRNEIESDFKTRSEITMEQRFARAKDKIARIVKAGLISAQEATSIIAKYQSPEDKVSAVFNRIAHKVDDYSTYEGQGKNASYHNMRKRQTNANAYVPQKGSRELARRKEIAQEKIAGLISANLVSMNEVERVSKKASTPEGKLRAVLRLIESKTDKVSTYQGEADNFEARLTTSQLKKIQDTFFNKQSSQSKVAYEKKVMGQINTLIQSGVVSMDQFDRIVEKHASLQARLNAIYSLVSKPVHVKKASGQTGHYGAKFSKKAEISYTASDWSKAQAKVSKLVETGLLTQDQLDSISSAENPNEFVRKAFDMASKPADATQYQGEQTAHILGNKKSNTMTATEKKVATWVRQKMSEGSAGEELDVLIATRFNQNVINEYNSRIASIRSEHEGLSGHAYVDASAYMTKGTDGCDKGALVHRANQIPTLLKTSKCGSCVFNVGGSCQKYNKPIIASADEIVESPQSYQQEMIRLANASDSEQTASLFVNNYDANEFNLTASEDVSVDDAPSHEELGDVLFGGFEV